MQKKKKCLAGFISIMLIIVFCISGCSGEDNKEESTEENVIETESKTAGFSTEYMVEDAKDGYFIVSKLDGALFGVLDSFGNEVIPLEYDNITFPESNEAKAVIVKAEGKMGLCDYEGNEILPVEYEAISNYGNNSDLYLIQKDGVQSLMGMDGSIQKSLKGTYDAVLNNAFLVVGFSRNFDLDSAMSVYSLNEELLCRLDLEKEDVESGLALFMEDVDGLMEVFSNDNYSSLMDESGKILYTTSLPTDGRDFGIYGLQNNNLFRIYSEGKENIYNLTTRKISEQGYKKIVRADANIVFASREDGNVDVYNMDGEKERTLDLAAESILIKNNTSLIVAEYGKTYRIYDKDGVELSDARYMEVESKENYWMIQNLDGQYGLMSPSGEMVIPFGGIGEETYNGMKWKNTYVFDNAFCIVTEGSNESNVWLFE